MNVSVILPAAGQSIRMAGDVRKPYLPLRGEMILLHTCRRMRSLSGVSEIILAVHPDDLPAVQGALWPELERAGVTLAVAGGASRAESVWNAFSASDPGADLIAVHDAVRPFVSARLSNELFSSASRHGAAVPVLPVVDTIKRVERDAIVDTVHRAGLMRAQTPQVFRRDVFLAANEFRLSTGGFTEAVTDDASLAEAAGRRVHAVMGEETNLKITTPRDLRIAEALLQAGLIQD